MPREDLPADMTLEPLKELTIRSMFDRLKAYRIIPSGREMKILDFFYMLFPEEMLKLNPSVYRLVKSSSRGSNVFNRTFDYPNIPDERQAAHTGEWGKDFYQNFGKLVAAYYGDVTAQCRRFLNTYASLPEVSAKAPSILNMIQDDFLSSLFEAVPAPSYPCLRMDGQNLPSQIPAVMNMNRFFNDCITFLHQDKDSDLLSFLLLGNPYLSWGSNPPNADDLLAAIALCAVFGIKTRKHFYALSLLPKHLQLLADEDYRCSVLMKQSGFANNELEQFHRKWKSPLFLHTGSPAGITLQKLYLPPAFTEDTQSAFDPSHSDLLNMCFAKSKAGYVLDSGFYHRSSIHLLYVLGQPGIGKSSFAAYLIENLLYEQRGYRKVLILSFKNLLPADLEPERGGLFGAIKARTGIKDDRDFADTLMILDGFDEIRIANAGKRQQLIQDFEALLTEEAFDSLGLNVILTSREGYLPVDDSQISGSHRILHLQPFSYEMISEYNCRYNLACPDHPVKMFELPADTREKDCEIYGIPIILYMVHGTDLQISHIEDKNKLYNALFSTENGRIYARNDSSGDSKYTREKILCYDTAACELAYRMLELGTGPAIETYEERCILWEKRIRPRLTRLLQDLITTRTITLREEDIPDCIESVEDSYVSFNYYYEGTYTEINSLEFVHKSIYEYYAGLYISRQLLSFIRQLKDVEKMDAETRNQLLHAFAEELTRLLYRQELSQEILASLYYHLEKALKPEITPSQAPFRGRMTRYVQKAKAPAQLTFADACEQFHNGLLCLLGEGISIHLHQLWQQREEKLLEFPDFTDKTKTVCLFDAGNLVLSQCLEIEYTLFTFLYPTHDERCAHRRRFSASLAGALRHTHMVIPQDTWARLTAVRHISLNLSYCDLSGLSLSGLNLTSCRLTGADLTSCDLSFCDLSGISFRDTAVSRVCFTGACLKNAELNQLSRSGSNLKNCQFDRADLSYANLSYSIASGSTGLASARFYHTNLGGLYLGEREREDTAQGFTQAPSFDIDYSKEIPVLGGYFPEGRFFCYDSRNGLFRFPKGKGIQNASVYLGHFPQNVSGDDRDSPVEWRVLRTEKENGRIYALLLSEYILLYRPYLEHTFFCPNMREGEFILPNPAPLTSVPEWKDSSLYAYLNGTFLEQVFSPKEQEPIIDRGMGKLSLCLLQDLDYGMEDDPELKLLTRQARMTGNARNTLIPTLNLRNTDRYWLHPCQDAALLRKACQEGTMNSSDPADLGLNTDWPGQQMVYCIDDAGRVRTTACTNTLGVRPVMWYDITDLYE